VSNNLGSKDNPFTHKSQGDACYKLCKCAECGVVRQCTPNFDFYDSAYRRDDGLVCENCSNALMYSGAPIVRDIGGTKSGLDDKPVWVRPIRQAGGA
jgi:hypothetical protein